MYNGSPFVFGYQDGVVNYLHPLSLEAILGLFVSPSRGLLIYSPFFIFVPIGYWRARAESRSRFYFFSLLVTIGGVLVLSMWQNWDGGWGYGTRMLTDLLPYAALLLIPTFKIMSARAQIIFWVILGYAMLAHSFALWDYGTRWHWHWDNWKYDVWNVAESEPLYYFKQYWDMAVHFLSRVKS